MKPTSSLPNGLSRRSLLSTLAAIPTVIGPLGIASTPARAQTDPLPSWNEGAAKKSIADFVARVTTASGPDFVPPAGRIATFDNDGTLWAEQPLYAIIAEEY